ncbi:MAG: hypothetical protein LVQ97_03095 [Candidatus Micrarchaeales archaeon]|jgi:hypothetical protein|uniref:Uncharacterized protein n=1 Tax=Candidatus Micrarchaeum acidiphilum ARMAN-2 TaxID=425595 RepID=C7DGB5_MICA2|nr:MAG: hypothetical protein UNLARM2_0119 [Candidatus Micrarchaeum acidiphilum ARMAN-2]MCW6161145.1 hypothetical protein [Candidatus Micrarchaeales archaeon]
MDVSIVDREEFEKSRNALAGFRRNEVMTIDNAMYRLESFYTNTIILKYGEYRERILTSKRRLNKLSRLDNEVLEMEDELKADAAVLSKKEFIEKLNNCEEKLDRDREIVIRLKSEVKSAEDCINGLVVSFANFVFDNYRRVAFGQGDELVLDVVDRLALGEAYQDEMRMQFTESILDEIALRVNDNAELTKKVNDVRTRDSIYVDKILRSRQT